MNTDLCKSTEAHYGLLRLLYPSRSYCFSERQLYTQKTIFCYQVAVFTLLWIQKRTLDAKYSTIESVK